MAIFKVTVRRICWHEDTVIADSEADAKEIFVKNWTEMQGFVEATEYDDEVDRLSIEESALSRSSSTEVMDNE